MLISKKTHCPKCGSGMERATKQDSDYIWAVYSCTECTHALGTIIEAFGQLDNYRLFNTGTLGNTYMKEKDYFLKLKDYERKKTQDTNNGSR